MKVILTTNCCTVIREDTDLKFRKSGYASAESIFLYHVLKELKKQFPEKDFIKKRMWKDGHLVDEEQLYIRTRKADIMIYNGSYAIYDAGEEFNETGKITLHVVRD
jgi:hypothetical protein